MTKHKSTAKFRWLVAYDQKTLCLYLMHNDFFNEEAAEAKKARKVFRKMVTWHNPYAAEFVALDMRNGVPPKRVLAKAFSKDDDSCDWDLRSVIAVAEYGGPMPNEQQRNAYMEWRRKVDKQCKSLDMHFVTIPWDKEMVPEKWVDVVATAYGTYA